ncbi:hypothetical protein ACTOV4_23600 [Brucella sp. C7-11G]
MRSVNIPRLFRVRPDKEEKIKLIKDLSIKEREEVFAAVARVLQATACEAYVEGYRHYTQVENTHSHSTVLHVGSAVAVQGNEQSH